jgi:phosphoglycerol transferase MdoB-like AlkP superfamily enzyme
VQFLHATFPDRLAGMGALMLRLLLASMLVWPWGLRAALPAADLLGWAWLAALLLASGSLFPLGAGVALVVGSLDAGLDGWPFAGLLISLSLVGPGAYSVDALLFGRRVLRRPATRGGNNPKE